MQRSHRLSALLLTVALAAGGCAAQGEQLGEATDSSFQVKPIEGTSLSRVILSEAGYQRAGIELTPVRPATAAGQTTVPDSAIWYDPTGKTWVYVESGRLTFARVPVVVARYDGTLAVLSQGPAVGTDVVRIGAAELYGAELGVPGE